MWSSSRWGVSGASAERGILLTLGDDSRAVRKDDAAVREHAVRSGYATTGCAHPGLLARAGGGCRRTGSRFRGRCSTGRRQCARAEPLDRRAGDRPHGASPGRAPVASIRGAGPGVGAGRRALVRGWSPDCLHRKCLCGRDDRFPASGHVARNGEVTGGIVPGCRGLADGCLQRSEHPGGELFLHSRVLRDALAARARPPTTRRTRGRRRAEGRTPCT